MNVLHHVVYASEATVDFSDQAVRALLQRARDNNAGLEITGLLLLVERSFFQILEGPLDAVTQLYEKIGRDTRHRRVVKLVQEPIEKRDFDAWSMGLARATSKELAALPGFSDFFATCARVDQLSEGTARSILRAFREGKWRARVG